MKEEKECLGKWKVERRKEYVEEEKEEHLEEKEEEKEEEEEGEYTTKPIVLQCPMKPYIIAIRSFIVDVGHKLDYISSDTVDHTNMYYLYINHVFMYGRTYTYSNIYGPYSYYNLHVFTEQNFKFHLGKIGDLLADYFRNHTENIERDNECLIERITNQMER